MKEIIEKVKAFGDQKNPHHTLSLSEHCYKCSELAYEKKYDEVVFAAVFHDVGKIYTQTFDEEGIAHYYGHAETSSYLGLSMGFNLETAQLINYHMLCYNYKGGEDVWRTRFGEEFWKKLEMLHECDVGAH